MAIITETQASSNSLRLRTSAPYFRETDAPIATDTVYENGLVESPYYFDNRMVADKYTQTTQYDVPQDVPGNLLLQFDDVSEPTWDLAGQTVTDLGGGWFRHEITDGLATTRSLIQFVVDAEIKVGDTYRIGAVFRNRSSAGTDFRLALAEYNVSQWNGATSVQLEDLVEVGSPNEVVVETQRSVTTVDTDRMRFAIQMVNPPAGPPFQSIEFRNPYLIKVGTGGQDIGIDNPSEIP